jgi:hypothetical protein
MWWCVAAIWLSGVIGGVTGAGLVMLYIADWKI